MSDKQGLWVLGCLAVLFGFWIFSYWPIVEWPAQRAAEQRAADKQDRLASEITVTEYKMVWAWQDQKSHIPGVKEAIKEAMQDEKITRMEWDQIGDKIKEYKEIKDKYETIQKIKSR